VRGSADVDGSTGVSDDNLRVVGEPAAWLVAAEREDHGLIGVLRGRRTGDEEAGGARRAAALPWARVPVAAAKADLQVAGVVGEAGDGDPVRYASVDFDGTRRWTRAGEPVQVWPCTH